jgi:hypothetical protein
MEDLSLYLLESQTLLSTEGARQPSQAIMAKLELAL